MKKIVSAAAAALVLSGFAFADASFSVNYRTGIEVLSHQFGHKTTLFNGVTSSRTTSDALSFKGKADFGGLELEITPTYPNSTLENTNSDGTDQTGWKTEGSVVLSKYNGWINFGDFTFKSGAWDARAVGRVNKDIGNHEGKFWGELLKPGLANKLGTSGNGVDISQQNGKKKISNMLQYNNKSLGLEARAAFIESNADDTYAGTSDDNDNWNFANEQWFAEVGYTVKDLGRVLVNTKTSYKDQAFGIFVEPKLPDLSALTSLVGFTFEQNYGTRYTAGDKKGDEAKQYAMALDLRARYAINDELSVTGMFNWTAGDKINSAKNGKDGMYATWAMLNATYRLNETFVPFFSAIYSSGADCGAAGALNFTASYKASLRFYPGVEIYNTSNANIITGLVFDIKDFSGDHDNHENMKVMIPVLMRVKF